MEKLERLPGITVLRYNWKVTNRKKNVVVLSKMIKFKGNDSFRIGFKNPLPYTSPTLLFIATNLNKIGLKAIDVSFSSSKDPKIKKMELKICREDHENDVIQLFFAPMQPAIGRACSFIFTIHLTGIMGDYRVQQMDIFLSKQLMLSMNQYWTDFMLIARNGNAWKWSFSVHKWILAARSPVFAAILGEDEHKLLHYIDCSVDEMNQFIKFIYIGEFEEPVYFETIRLAFQYQIKTLQELNIAASQDISEDRIATLAFDLKPGSKKCKMETSKPDSDLETIKHDDNTTSFKLTWKVDRWTKKYQKGKFKNIARSEEFKHGENQVFQAELKTWSENNLAPNNQTFLVRFLNYGHENINCIAEDVICSIGQDYDSSPTDHFQMNEKLTRKKKLLQLFTITISDLANAPYNPSVVTFIVKLRSTVANFIEKPVDSTCNEQLWDAAVNRKMADVMFLVGEESYFGAHRSLLSARSPVFAAMFASGMKEATTGQVHIKDADPTTFLHFLRFLYTGMIEPSSLNKELFMVADKYQVETLMELCRSAIDTIDVDDV